MGACARSPSTGGWLPWPASVTRCGGISTTSRPAATTGAAAAGRPRAPGAPRAPRPPPLDKLVGAGLLDPRLERRSGRRGPGAGRTAKLYLRSAHPVEVALPARDYQLMAGLLARAVGADPSGAARSELLRSARALGAETAPGPAPPEPPGEDPVRSALAGHGYEPYDEEGVLRLRNCPFGRLAEGHRDLGCSANPGFLEGRVA